MNDRCIGYVLKVFPRVSETFVINEIRTLEQAGEAVSVFSLHRNPSEVPHRILRELANPVVYVEDAAVDELEVARARRQLSAQFGCDATREAQVLPRKYVRLALQLATSARSAGVTHLHAHFASRSGHVAALAAALLGCPYSITAHAKDIYHQDVDQDLLRWKIANACFVVTVTEYNRDHLQGLVAMIPGAAEKIVRLYNGVDLTRFHPRDRHLSDPPLFLAVGRLVEKKGFAILVDACARLRARGARFRCDIIGGGPEEASLGERIAAANLAEIVSLRGVLSTEEIAMALRGASAMVLPCIVASDGNVDALPTVLLEAAAAACPAVSTRLSGIPEIIVDGETGLLVAAGDAAALADAMAAILDDPKRARSMGLAARQRSECLFDLRANAARLQEWLRAGAAASSAAVGEDHRRA